MPVPREQRTLSAFDMGILWGDLGIGLLVLVTGALLVPGSLALISASFDDERRGDREQHRPRPTDVAFRRDARRAFGLALGQGQIAAAEDAVQPHQLALVVQRAERVHVEDATATSSAAPALSSTKLPVP